jgi:hypothetical protein
VQGILLGGAVVAGLLMAVGPASAKPAATAADRLAKTPTAGARA